MSYILEALKKSQQQSEQQAEQPLAQPASPSVTEWPASHASKLPRWPWHRVLLLVVVMFVVVLLVVLLRWQQSDNLPWMAGEMPAPAVAKAGPAAAPVESVDDVKTVPDTVADISTEPALQVPTQTVVPAKPTVSPSAPSSASGQVTQRTLPPLSELRKIPDLIITGHIYSTQASTRQVTMNGRVWEEGDRITDSVTLTSITHDGIELDVAGWPLTIHRNRGWQSLSD